MKSQARLTSVLVTYLPALPNALCRIDGVHDPSMWQPDDDVTSKERLGLYIDARAVCKSCPERRPCYEFAAENEAHVYGIWGGVNFDGLQKKNGIAS